VDTGAEVTCLQPTDWSQWAIDYAQLDGSVRPIIGSGGSTDAKVQRATILFTEDSGLMHLYGQDIFVLSDSAEERDLPSKVDEDMPPGSDQSEERNLPSTLGQDILSYWRLVHDPSRGDLSADVHWAGWTFNPG